MSELRPERLRPALATRVLAGELVYLERTGSTNQEARRLAEQGAPEGTLVVCEEQLAGRGRRGRRWLAPYGTSLLYSLIFYPRDRWPQLGMAACLGAAEGIRRVAGLQVELKWPNDLLVGGSKVGGVLLEAVPGAGGWCVVGTGINVNWDPRGEGGPGLPASSLSLEAGRPLDRGELLAAILEAVEARYLRWRAGESLLPEWRACLSTLGREVRVIEDGEEWAGRALEVDSSGALVVLRADGRRITVHAAEVSLR